MSEFLPPELLDRLKPAQRRAIKFMQRRLDALPPVPVATPTVRTLLDWCYEYLPEHFYGDQAPFHAEIESLLASHDRLAIAAPRGHNKSTLISLGYVLYKAAQGEARFILIVSDSADQAKDHVGNVQKELLENIKLTDAYPHLKLPDASEYRTKKVRRKASDFITSGGVRFVARGSGAGLRGMREGSQRPDLIVVDDLENDKNVETPGQRKKLKNWFLKSLSNLFGAAGGQLAVVGTILHKDSLLNWLIGEDGPPSYAKRRYTAIQEDGTAIWPAAWTLELLKAKRIEIGSRAFATEFLNDPSEDDAVLFKEEWITRTRVMTYPALTRIVVALDPSSSEDGARDACGLIVAGRGEDKRVYILADLTLNGSPATWGRAALDAYHRYHANEIVAEKNQGGGMVTQTMKAELQPGESLPPIKLVTAKQSKSLRAEPVAVMYERGEVSHVGNLIQLEDEQTAWVPGMPSPNRLDALVYAVLQLTVQPTQFRAMAH